MSLAKVVDPNILEKSPLTLKITVKSPLKITVRSNLGSLSQPSQPPQFS